MEWENQLIQELQWSNKISNKASKELVAQEIAGLAKDGDVIGAGSGSTVYLTLFALAQRVKQESLHIEIIPASAEISMTCIQLGLPQTTLWNKRPDWTFDGADEEMCIRDSFHVSPKKATTAYRLWLFRNIPIMVASDTMFPVSLPLLPVLVLRKN